MADSTNLESPDITDSTASKPQDLDNNHQILPTKTPPSVKFTNTSTFADVLRHDIVDLDRANIMNLKKDVLADFIMYLIKPPPTCPHDINDTHKLNDNNKILKRYVTT